MHKEQKNVLLIEVEIIKTDNFKKTMRTYFKYIG